MKKFLFTLLAVVAMAMTAPVPTQAQDLSKEQKQQAIELIKQRLPMQTSEGMTWTGLDLENNGTQMHLTFVLDPTEMGTDSETLQEGFAEMTNDQCKEFLGDEFNSMLKMFDMDARLTIALTDGWSKDFFIRH